MAALQSKVRTCWWFDGNGLEAARFYCSLLPDSHVEGEFGYAENTQEPVVIEFVLASAPMMILNGGDMFTPNEAASISVLTDDQDETDRLWDALSSGGTEAMCGWLKDRYGISWQIVPKRLVELSNDRDQDAATRVRKAMYQMKKIDIAALEAAHVGD